MFIYVVVNGRICSFSRSELYSVVLHTTFSSFICLLVDILIFSIPWLLQLMLQLTRKCIFLFEILISILLNIYQGVGLLDHMIFVFLVFRETIFHSGCMYHFTFSPTVYKGFNISTSWPSYPHRNIYLATIFGPENLLENPRI